MITTVQIDVPLQYQTVYDRFVFVIGYVWLIRLFSSIASSGIGRCYGLDLASVGCCTVSMIRFFVSGVCSCVLGGNKINYYMCMIIFMGLITITT